MGAAGGMFRKLPAFRSDVTCLLAKPWLGKLTSVSPRRVQAEEEQVRPGPELRLLCWEELWERNKRAQEPL